MKLFFGTAFFCFKSLVDLADSTKIICENLWEILKARYLFKKAKLNKLLAR